MSALLLLSIAAGGRRQSVLIGAAGAMLGLLFVTRPVGLFFYIAFLAYILTSEAFPAFRNWFHSASSTCRSNVKIP